MALTPHTRLGPYEVTDLLGAGGMGEVYRARDTRLDRTVAIKVLPSALSADPALRERFEREARAVAALNHPHICVLHDVGHHDGIDFLVMEHVAGETLAQRLKKGALPLEQVLQFGIQIADALDRAHRAGIVHRDLKPGNIMVTGAGRDATIKLLDFGLAKVMAPAAMAGISQAATDQRELTGAGTVPGTVQYMAPEQLEAGVVDARTDIFALGAVLYEMATGRKAFDGKSQVSVIAAILEHQPAPIHTLQPLTPPEFERLVSTCLAKAPDDRWQSARDVARELKWIATHRAAPLTPAPTRPVVNWVRWTATAAIGVALLIAAAVATRPWWTATTVPQEVLRFDMPTPMMPNPMMLSVSPDGKYVAFVAVAENSSTPMLFVRPLNSTTAQRLAGTEGAAMPFWSPDSRHIGFGAQRQLKRIDVTGGPPQTICDLATAIAFLGGTWNADNVIVFAIALSPLMRVAAAGGQAAPLTTLDTSANETMHAWPSFLPDGQHFLFLASAPAGQSVVKLGSLTSAETSVAMRANSNAIYASGRLLFNRDGTLMAQPFDTTSLRTSGEPVRVADGLAYNPQTGRAAYSVSNTGVLIYRSGGAFEPTQLTWYDRRGTRLGTEGEPAVYRGLGLSPDDRLLAVHVHQEPSGGDVWIINRDRGNATKFTFTAHNFSPRFSRDGKYVLFTSDREGLLNLYRKAVGGASGEEMAYGSGGAAFVEDMSNDGEWLVYGECGAASGCDVWRVPVMEKGEKQRLVGSNFFDGLSKISPDERWLAYESDESGRRDIYVQQYPTGTTKYQVSTEGGRYVRWSSSGNELFYLKDDGSMVAVSVKTVGADFVAGKPATLFRVNPLLQNHRGSALDIPYDVTRDGQRFIVNERLSTATQQYPISVVVNWPSVLPER